ncbi:MAG: L-ribulose-5-phosphate 4-epimerase [Victivallaceae bacterium]|nr:L-ribulose-5-phosphate 4-epimerase [Victivallaceae bacterium]
MHQYDELKRQCFEANLALPRLGLVFYTFGNASAGDRQAGVFAIKPSGVPYDKLTWQDMIVLDFDHRQVSGKLRPSSDTPTHAVLYREIPDIGGIVHTHSTNAVAWAQAKRPVPIYGTTHADHLPGDVPCTPEMSDRAINGNYEEETGYQIIKTLKTNQLSPAHVPMVLVASHGPFTWGRDAFQAVYHSKVLEEICTMALLSEQLDSSISRIKKTLIKKHFERKHGNGAYYGQ